MERKKLTEIVASIIVFVLFLSGYGAYASFGSGTQGGSATASTTTAAPVTVFASAFANAIIQNYTQNLQINVACKNSSVVVNLLSDLLSNLQTNSSVSAYLPTGSQIAVQTGSMNALAFYKYADASLNASERACTRFVGTANARLPLTLNFTYIGSDGRSQTSPEPLSAAMRAFSLPLPLNYSATSIPVKAIAFIEYNGTIYQLQINATKGA